MTDDRSTRDTALAQVLELTLLLGEDMSRSLTEDGLTESRAHVLWVLGAGGPCPQKDLASALGVSPRTITGLVDGLVETGFVTRESHPSDRRATLVTPTDRGGEVIATFAAGQRELADQLFADLPPGQLEALTTGMDEVLARLRQLVAEAPGAGRSAAAEAGRG